MTVAGIGTDEAIVYAVVALHYAVTLVPFAGAFLMLRWRWLLWVHLPILAWAISIPFLQYPCPLTDLERELRADAGMPVYEVDFISEYIYRPLGRAGVLWDAFCWSSVTTAYWLYFRHRPPATAQGAA